MTGNPLILALLSTEPSPPVSEGLQVTLLGITAVFGGLLLLAVLLPLIRRASETEKAPSPAGKAAQELSPEEVAAVSVAIHTHLCRLEQEEETKLTWQDHDKPYSPWRLAGRAKMLLSRTGRRPRDRRV